MYCVLLFDVMLISPMPCLRVLLQVDEQVIDEPGTQLVENTEQELIEGKLCLDHSLYPIMFYIITVAFLGLILMGTNRSP
jgi:hypothetical protein